MRKKPKRGKGSHRMMQLGKRSVTLWFSEVELEGLDAARKLTPRATWCRETVMDEVRVRQMTAPGAGQTPAKVVKSHAGGKGSRR